MTSLSHTAAREYIQQLADGEALRAEARQALHQHLMECVECRAYAEEIKTLHQTLSRAFRTRWEQQPMPRRVWPPIARPRARQWGPLVQVLVMLTMTIMVLSLLPEWSRWPAAPPTPAPTATHSSPAVNHQTEAIPDEGLESLIRLAEHEAFTPSEATAEDDPAEGDPYYMNDPDHRASRVQ